MINTVWRASLSSSFSNYSKAIQQTNQLNTIHKNAQCLKPKPKPNILSRRVFCVWSLRFSFTFDPWRALDFLALETAAIYLLLLQFAKSKTTFDSLALSLSCLILSLGSIILTLSLPFFLFQNAFQINSTRTL